MTHVVVWVSPRGFANEGTYLFGPVTSVIKSETYQDAKRIDGHVITTISYHRSMDRARARAQKEIGIAHRRERWGEQSYDNIEEVSE